MTAAQSAALLTVIGQVAQTLLEPGIVSDIGGPLGVPRAVDAEVENDALLGRLWDENGRAMSALLHSRIDGGVLASAVQSSGELL